MCTFSHLCRIEREYVASCRVKSGELQKSLAAVRRDVLCAVVPEVGVMLSK